MALDQVSIALLALLAEEPATPAAVRAAFGTRRHDRIIAWDEDSLDAAIRDLRERGFLREVDRDSLDETARLAPTPAGQAALVDWTRAALAERAEERPLFDLALLTAHSVPVEVAREALAARLAELDELTSQLTTRIRTSSRRGLSEEYGMQADYRRSLLVAEFTWLARLLERVDSGELTWRVGEKPAAPPETA